MDLEEKTNLPALSKSAASLFSPSSASGALDMGGFQRLWREMRMTMTTAAAAAVAAVVVVVVVAAAALQLLARSQIQFLSLWRVD